MPNILLLIMTLLLTACGRYYYPVDNGLKLADGWHIKVIARWQRDRPDMLQLNADQHTLYLSFENTKSNKPAFGRIMLGDTPRVERLLYGLKAGDGLRLDAHGNVWLGEETSGGHLWMIAHPEHLLVAQHIDRENIATLPKTIRRVDHAGRLAYEGFAFSANGRFLYLLDEWHHGALYRLRLADEQLYVFHRQQGWLPVPQPVQARSIALRLHAATFQRGEDMELMPDGTLLFAETSTGMIQQLDDRGSKPVVRPFLHHAAIAHPDNLEWDRYRHCLWITDDSRRSELWRWDQQHGFQRIAHTDVGEITGVETASDGRIWINLQGQRQGQDQTVELFRLPLDVVQEHGHGRLLVK